MSSVSLMAYKPLCVNRLAGAIGLVGKHVVVYSVVSVLIVRK